ncbi:hypothetical protein PMI14_06778 [Acidovorax sp. CF316]|uniref:hypothetical protein n=1 Tax=Acidovorax sp. CF316 TaxID=1144317 RepID=UPI00026BE2EB|nr:hypothetical protein [Acidovorax sp. CF316]EJE48777.1 hypothetical protein PMI14_06778 [Acidovorax sp. CF316]
MKQLHVTLDYGTANYGEQVDPDAALALPIKALDSEGTVLDDGAATVHQTATLQVPEATELAFVRLTWPSGRTETKRVDLSQAQDGRVTFADTRISPNEWSAWAVPKLNPRTPLARPELGVNLGMDQFEKVWLRLWRFDGHEWHREQIEPLESHRSNAAWQMDLRLSRSYWMLQIGGSGVTWRFVALPGDGRVRVLLTPRDSRDKRADDLKVVVTSFRASAETLLEFMSRDAMRSVNTLADSASFARHLISEKFEDPVAAVAGAYYLLRVNQLERVPLWWFENLSSHFSWLPDAAIVHCARLLREGSSVNTDHFNPETLFAESLARGWPIYAEGIGLLQEAASLLGGTSKLPSSLFQQVQALDAAKAWAGAIASFYGRHPSNPEALHWTGMPKAPRRRRLLPELAKPRAARDTVLASRESRSVPRSPPRDRTVVFAMDKVPTDRLAKANDEEFLLGSVPR